MNEPALDDEEGRIRALQRLHALDSEPEKPFETIMNLVEQTLDVPMCAVSLVDRTRQWFMARRGLDVCETARDISFCTHTIRQHEPFIVSNAWQHPLFANNPLVVGAPYIASYVGAPIRISSGYNVGSICAIDTRPRDFSPSDVALLTHFSKIAADELELRRIASTDELTGVLSRRAWLEAAEARINDARQYQWPLALAMIDIDHFKPVNDTYGHAAGDNVIKTVAQAYDRNSRKFDVFGRLGGEEFGLLLPETTPEEAFSIAERHRKAIEALVTEAAEDIRVTVSTGIAALCPHTDTLETLIANADNALYFAKNAGRNRVCVDSVK